MIEVKGRARGLPMYLQVELYIGCQQWPFHGDGFQEGRVGETKPPKSRVIGGGAAGDDYLFSLMNHGSEACEQFAALRFTMLCQKVGQFGQGIGGHQEFRGTKLEDSPGEQTIILDREGFCTLVSGDHPDVFTTYYP